MYLSNLDIYWFTRLEEVKSLLTFDIAKLLFIGAIASLLICVLTNLSENSKGEVILDTTKALTMAKRSVKYLILYLCIPTILTIAAVFIPTQKEMAAIIMIPAIVNNEALQKVPDNVLNLLNAKLEEWLSDSTGSVSPAVPVKK